MTLEQFEVVIKHMHQAYEKANNLHSNGIDVSSFEEHYYHVIENLLTEIYSKEGYGWIMWYCYDNSFGKGKLKAWDSKQNLICYDVKSLYDYLQKTYKETDVDEVTRFNNEYVSLYDFLGRAAGSTLGMQVHAASLMASVVPQERMITNKAYNGPVKLYPRYFLENFFNKLKQEA